MPSRSPTSTLDPAFQSTVANWIESTGEVFVVIRYPWMAGNKSYELFHQFDAFVSTISGLRPSTLVVVLKGHHLPIRGRFDDELRSKIRNAIPEGAEWLIIGLEEIHRPYYQHFPYTEGDTRESLEEDLNDENSDLRGMPVAAGLMPPWYDHDSEAITKAFVPNSDGTIRIAAYSPVVISPAMAVNSIGTLRTFSAVPVAARPSSIPLRHRRTM